MIMLTEAQREELDSFLIDIRYCYFDGIYEPWIKECFEHNNMSYLVEAILIEAGVYFDSLAIPFVSVYRAINTFIEEVRVDIFGDVR